MIAHSDAFSRNYLAFCVEGSISDLYSCIKEEVGEGAKNSLAAISFTQL